MQDAAALLYKKVSLPDEFVRDRTGGDIRIGDLTGDGQVDFLVYNALGGIKPCFLGAFSLAGEPLWSVGDRDFTVLNADEPGRLATISPDRPGPVAICDIDQDGRQEVLCFLVDPHVKRTSKWNLADVHIAILDGRTGAVKRCTAPEELARCNAYADGEMHVPNYVHQRLLIANFSGHDQPRDFVVKLGCDVLAFNDQLEVLWHYRSKWHRYPEHAAYIPAVGDLDGDGRDEGQRRALRPRSRRKRVVGKPFWGDHADSVLVDRWGTEPAAIVSGRRPSARRQRTPPAALGGGRGTRTGRRCAAATCGPSYPAANWPSATTGTTRT